MTDGRTPSVEQTDSRVSVVAEALRREGWTCEMHEPDPACGICRNLHKRTAKAILRALDDLADREYDERDGHA